MDLATNSWSGENGDRSPPPIFCLMPYHLQRQLMLDLPHSLVFKTLPHPLQSRTRNLMYEQNIFSFHLQWVQVKWHVENKPGDIVKPYLPLLQQTRSFCPFFKLFFAKFTAEGRFLNKEDRSNFELCIVHNPRPINTNKPQKGERELMPTIK